jgi:hypothetical protein
MKKLWFKISKCDIEYWQFQIPMEKPALKNANHCLITNIYSYLETSGANGKAVKGLSLTLRCP